MHVASMCACSKRSTNHNYQDSPCSECSLELQVFREQREWTCSVLVQGTGLGAQEPVFQPGLCLPHHSPDGELFPAVCLIRN